MNEPFYSVYLHAWSSGQVRSRVKVITLLQEGKTAIHYAAAYSKDDLVKLLLNKKADTNVAAGVCLSNIFRLSR